MLLVRDYQYKTLGPVVATFGNFDGVHLGHRKILSKLQKVSNSRKLKSAVILFEPQPREYFAAINGETSERLMSLRQKLVIFNKFSVDIVICLRFNAKLAAISPQDFINNFLLQQLQIKYLMVGNDCAFGRNSAGGVNLLQNYAGGGVFVLDVVSPETVGGIKISSSRIRLALHSNDFMLAQQMLGEPYTLGGKVSHGDERGRKLGYPTANVVLQQKALPLNGVYFGEVALEDGSRHYGIANIGFRPTFAVDKPLLEVHILNFNQDLYGQRIGMTFLYKIRDEIKFNSARELIAQLQKDAKIARQLLHPS